MIFDQDPPANSQDNVIPLGKDAFVFNVDTQNFEEKVVKASMERPVLVDFWAPWCGPCKQLMPVLEKLVNARSGDILLAKINLDENQQLASMMQVQSVPTVYAFLGGQPVDAFQGNVPESHLAQFMDKLIQMMRNAQPDAIDIAEFLQDAAQALADGDLQTAQMLYTGIMQQEPSNAQAFAGMVRVFIAAGQNDHAKTLLDQAPPEIKKTSSYTEAKSALELAQMRPDSSASDLKQKLEKNPNDHQARYDMALHEFSSGKREEAIDDLLYIIEKKRDWNEEAARHQLLKFFEAIGHSDPLTIESRRRLSSILFS